MSDPARTAPRRPLRRLFLAFINLDSFGSVMVLIFATYLLSVTVTASWGKALVLVVQIATVWVTLRASRARRLARVIANAILVISALAALVNLFIQGTASTGLLAVLSGLLYLVAPVSIVRHLALRRMVDLQTVLGAIAAYLLVGMFFAFLYRALGALQSEMFFGSQGEGTFPQDLFFSFTTLTTTGYGNLVPDANPGQTFAVMEMLVGQLFLVTAVAKVINVWQPGHAGTGPRAHGEE